MIFDKKQYGILSERYFDCLCGDIGSLIWMLGQAPLIAGLVIFRFKSVPATESLYFVLALSAVWFGCINACRVIAAEKAIYIRERLFGLNRAAYLLSKATILALIGLVEIVLFFVLLDYNLSLSLNTIYAVIALFWLYICGMSLGLLLSRWCGSVSRAVVAVPLVILPQIIFSKFVLPRTTLKGVAVHIEKMMAVRWGFEAIINCTTGNVDFGNYFSSFVILFMLSVLFLVLTYGHLVLVSDTD